MEISSPFGWFLNQRVIERSSPAGCGCEDPLGLYGEARPERGVFSKLAVLKSSENCYLGMLKGHQNVLQSMKLTRN